MVDFSSKVTPHEQSSQHTSAQVTLLVYVLQLLLLPLLLLPAVAPAPVAGLDFMADGLQLPINA
jgi:hypothetical protein